MKRTIFLLIITVFTFSSGANETVDIEKHAMAGDLAALNQAFALYASTNAAFTEELDIAIGASILRNPKNFLIALKKNRSKVPNLSGVLGNLGNDFTDDFKRQKIELKKRLTAIHSIKDESLRASREECEVELRREIANTPSE